MKTEKNFCKRRGLMKSIFIKQIAKKSNENCDFLFSIFFIIAEGLQEFKFSSVHRFSLRRLYRNV